MKSVMKLGVVSDDLQGANLCGARLADAGLRPVVATLGKGGASLASAEAPILNAGCRLMKPAEAHERVRIACRQMRDLGCTHIYKFSDSAARGHPGVEVDAVLDELGVGRAAFALVLPSARRVTIGGYLLDDGCPVSESPTGRDLLSPVAESYLPSLLSSQSHRSVGLVPLSVVDRGPEAIAETMVGAREEVLVVDSASQAQLAGVARALAIAGMDRAIFGSGGLVGELPAALGLNCTMRRPVLVICGSANPISQSQVKTLVESGRADLVSIDVRRLLGESEAPGAAASAALDSLRRGRNVAVTIVGQAPGAANLSILVGHALARIAREAVGSADLFAFGGETAQRVMDELGIEAVEIEGEAPVGAMLCRVIDGPHAGRLLITKSGGIGGPNLVVDAVQTLRTRRDCT